MKIKDGEKKGLELAMLAGKILCEANAEAYRVEDTVEYILVAAGFSNINVLTQSSEIIVSVKTKAGEHITRMVRVKSHEDDLSKLILINQISRNVFENDITVEAAYHETRKIDEAFSRPNLSSYVGLSCLGAAFVFVFKGSIMECIGVFLVGIVYAGLVFLNQSLGIHKICFYSIASMIVAILCSAISIYAQQYQLVLQIDRMITSSIMPIVPGLSFTNAIRDIMRHDNVSGLFKLQESFLIAASIALGVGFGLTISGYFK